MHVWPALLHFVCCFFPGADACAHLACDSLGHFDQARWTAQPNASRPMLAKTSTGI